MHHLRFFDDYGSGWLWSGDDAARAAFGAGPLDDRLAPLLSVETRALAARLSALHAQSLNQDYPPDGCQWPEADCAAFDAEVETLFQHLRAELGSDFHLIDQRMVLRKGG